MSQSLERGGWRRQWLGVSNGFHLLFRVRLSFSGLENSPEEGGKANSQKWERDLYSRVQSGMMQGSSQRLVLFSQSLLEGVDGV